MSNYFLLNQQGNFNKWQKTVTLKEQQFRGSNQVRKVIIVVSKCRHQNNKNISYDKRKLDNL